MSLFPAYPGTSQTPESSPTKVSDTKWLENSSYSFKLPPQSMENDDDVVEVYRSSSEASKREKEYKSSHKEKKKKKINSEKKAADSKKSDSYPLGGEKFKEYDIFFIDKTRSLMNLSAKTCTTLSKPLYFKKFPGLAPRKSIFKSVKGKRYFKFNYSSRNFKEETLNGQDIVFKKAGELNKKLSEDPHDIPTWIELVKIQDEIYKYQKYEYKAEKKRYKKTAKRKLEILDKAISKNPDNMELQAMWLKKGSSSLPSEEMTQRIEKILEDSGGTIILWLGLMTTTQYSLARCTFPSVTKLYERLLVNFQKVQQPNKYGRDLNVLELLFHYGRFLDQCDHWEILWTMIKVNLQFNTSIDLSIHIDVDEKVKDLENQVLDREKQAIWKLWNQLERLREGLHFLPDDNSISFPQRCVLPESVVNFTWHFHPDLHFQLIVSFIVLLKVPLLPTSHTCLKCLVPNSLPWVFDSPEFILACVFSSPAVNLKYRYLDPITKLTKGPQYLTKFNGQTEFFKLIHHTFQTCLKHLDGRKKAALSVWWLRFERWIHLLEKLNLAFLPDDKKTAKDFFKNFLQIEENRNNLLYYTEYSLLELNMGKPNACIKSLRTLISSQPPVLSLPSNEEKETLTSVYRTLCEVLVGENQNKNALNLLINLGSGNRADAAVTIHTAVAAEKKFEELSMELIQGLESSSFSFESLLMPVFAIDWVSLYFWFIALKKTPTEFRQCWLNIFQLLDNQKSVLAELARENLKETVLTISWNFEINSYFYMKSLVKDTLQNYPNNLKFLSFMANFDLINNTYWWALKKTFLASSSFFGSVFLACIALGRYEKDKENYENRIKNLFQSLADKNGKLSSMLHSLRLNFLYANEDSGLENAQLQAIESCPWDKGLYLESISLLPAKLMQLTDVLIEKEMRLHITPDEVEEMRS